MGVDESVEKSAEPALDPVSRDFILYCLGDGEQTFPALYDRMCWVASHRLFRGMGYEGLRKAGLSLSLNGIEETYKMVDAALAQAYNPRHF